MLCVAIVPCWVLLFLDANAYWDWRAADAVARHVSDAEMMDATADGANMLFILLFGWIPALIYCLMWQTVLWFAFFRKKSALKVAIQ